MDLFIFGGSFNPFHNGHRSLVEFILRSEENSQVKVIPAGQAPMKSTSGLVENRHRLEIIKRSLSDLKGWHIDPLELERSGPSYTVDTLRELKTREQWQQKPYLVIGDDWVEQFHRWKESEALMNMVRIALFHRQWKEEKPFPYPHRYLNNPLVQVSSTEIRDRLSQGKPVSAQMHPAAAEYLEGYGLYRS